MKENEIMIPFDRNMSMEVFLAHFPINGATSDKDLKRIEDFLQRASLLLSEIKKQKNMVKIKYYLKKRKIECYNVLKGSVGVTDSKTFGRALKELYERGMIEEVGLEDPEAVAKREIYQLTNSLKGTRSYYKNIEDNDFTPNEYAALISKRLKDKIESHDIEYARKVEQAKWVREEIQTKKAKMLIFKQPKWVKAAYLLHKRFPGKFIKVAVLKRFLTSHTNVFPSTSRLYNENFNELVATGAITQEKKNDQHGYRVNPNWEVPEVL